MAITTIQDAIGEIRDFPYANEQSARMVQMLSEHADLFTGCVLQFSISMGLWLNVRLDDGYHGIRGVEERDHAWFTFGPDQRRFVLRTGFGAEIFTETVAGTAEVATLLGDGIRHLAESSEP